jgi:hypothetical protein
MRQPLAPFGCSSGTPDVERSAQKLNQLTAVPQLRGASLAPGKTRLAARKPVLTRSLDVAFGRDRRTTRFRTRNWQHEEASR